NIKKIKYNNYEFIQNGEYWTANINSYDLLFKYNPNEVQKIDSTVNKISSYSGSPLYIYTPNEEVYYELYRNMQPFVQRIQIACLKGDDCKGIAEKTCDDNLIIVKYSDNINIKQNKSCVFIYTPIENATMAVDEFLFKVLSVEP
ncbi:MAG: hypothetical protein Q7R52_03995, partial [archaeon]|nr:hypothetical protein [archaeon]